MQVFLNGDKLPIKNFMEYVELYMPDKSVPRIHEKVNDRWEIVVAATPGQFQQVPTLSPFLLVLHPNRIRFRRLFDRVLPHQIHPVNGPHAIGDSKQQGKRRYGLCTHLALMLLGGAAQIPGVHHTALR